MYTISIITSKAILEALNLLFPDRDVSGSGPSSLLEELAHTCCVHVMLLLLRTVEKRGGNIRVKERQGRATQVKFHACILYIKLTRKCRMCAEEIGTAVASDQNEEKMNKFKDPEFMSQFIGKYREMRNLWQVKHSAYYNKPVRKAMLERLLAFVQTLIQEATMEILERKIGILRNMYRREHNKIQASLISGASADD
ncbi:hypothetical protein AB205_0132250, partial [Aquarana catesbeiana]